MLGGVLLEYFWWGSVFLLAIPVMALLLVLGPASGVPRSAGGRLDLLSAGMSLAAILAVIYGLKETVQDGFGPQPAAILAGLVIGLLFVRPGKTGRSLIDLRLFRIPTFSVSLSTNMLAIFVAVGYYLFVAQYLRLVLGLLTAHGGPVVAASAVGFIVGSNLAPHFVHRVRPAIVLGAALGLAALALGMLARSIGHPAWRSSYLRSCDLALALSPVFTLTTELIVGSAPPEKAGSARDLGDRRRARRRAGPRHTGQHWRSSVYRAEQPRPTGW